MSYKIRNPRKVKQEIASKLGRKATLDAMDAAIPLSRKTINDALKGRNIHESTAIEFANWLSVDIDSIASEVQS